MKYFSTLSPLLALIAFVAISVSCSKDEAAEYPVKITVLSKDSIPVQNAYVEADADVLGSRPSFSGYTDLRGQVKFTYDMEAVLRVIVRRGDPTEYIGCDYVRLKEDREVKLTVYLRDYDPGDPGCGEED